MACPLCAVNPTAHSFEYLGHSGQIKLYYTNPAKATANEPVKEKLVNIQHHLKAISGAPWIWVFDFADATMKDYMGLDFSRMVTNVLDKEHAQTLQKIILVNAGSIVMGLLKMALATLKGRTIQKAMVLDGSKLEIVRSLETAGLCVESKLRVLKKCKIVG
jgi:hypothetical protein